MFKCLSKNRKKIQVTRPKSLKPALVAPDVDFNSTDYVIDLKHGGCYCHYTIFASFLTISTLMDKRRHQRTIRGKNIQLFAFKEYNGNSCFVTLDIALHWMYSYAQCCKTVCDCNYILFTKLPWPGDSEGTFPVFESSCHLPTYLPHTAEASHCLLILNVK